MSDLQRYLSAHDADAAYERALAEFKAGRKHSHWIWFVLPQLRSLGRSAMAQRYGLADLEEAQAYLADPLLRQRYETVVAVIREQLRNPQQRLELLMGSGLDAAKTISSLTLFEAAGLASAGELLDQIGRRCPLTLERLALTPAPADPPLAPPAPPARPAADQTG